jgi:hypothetical protein
MFDNIKQFQAIKSPDKEGIVEGFKDMMDKGFVPISPLLKYHKEYMLIIVEYKKEIECQKN